MPDTTQYFKALADETRLRLLHVLSRYECNVNELVAVLRMGQSRISRHLKILSSAGLLVWRREGLWVFYSIPQEGPGRDFINAVLPFVEADPVMRADDGAAARMIEERLSSTRHFFNAIAEDWDKFSREILGGFDLPTAVRARMPKVRTAADLGCGTGAVLGLMPERADKAIGVDDSPRMLELARRRLAGFEERISLRIGDLAHLPLADGEADFICLNLVLHHLADPQEALYEVRRVVAKGGTLVVTDFNRHEDERMRSEYGDRRLGFEAAVLREYLLNAGFRVEKSELVPVERNLSLHIITAAAV